MATIAISVATGVAAQIARSWLQPTQVIDNGGLSDLSIPKSNYGVTIPQAWGTVMVSGNLIWGTHKEEVVKKKKRGKGGGGRVEKNRSYYGNCAWLFGYNPNSPAISFKRLWMNGKVVYSTVGDAETINNGDDFAAQYLRFYLGTNTQTPDPLLESLKPSSSYDYGLPHDPDEREAALISLGLDPNTIYTPAYRYRSYCVAERIPLNDFGNQLPTVKAEIVFSDPCYLANIITDICLQAGLTANQIDVTGVAGIGVTGFYLDSVKKASEALQLLAQCYFFDIIQSQGKLIFTSRSAARPVIDLDTASLATHVYGQARPNTYTEEPEYIEALPAEVDVNFIDPDLDYEENTAKARSQVSQSLEKKIYNLPIVLTADKAIALSEKILHQHYLTSKKYSFTLPPALAFLEIGDRLLFNNQTIQVTKIGLGANLLLNVNAKLFDAGSISTISVIRTVETGGYNPPLADNVITSAGDTTLLILDIPLIGDRDEERGVYLTGGGGSYWNGADIYVSINGSTYELVSGLDTYGVYGSANTVLGTDVEVILDKGELASATTADLDAGYNKALVGDEIIQFETATLIATNTYTLSGLRRGLRGTEWVTSHSVGERFVLLTGENSYIERVTNSAIAPGQTLYFKALSNGQSLDSVNPVTITYQGNDLKPYAPTNIAASKDEAGNITITWDRRDRKAGEAIDLTKIPLSETREEYKLEIQLNTSIIRTVIIENNDYYNYLASEQVSDFGAIQFSITVNLYQVSTVVEDGYRATGTLNPSLVAGSPVISSFSPVQGIEGDVIVLTGSGFTDAVDVAINGISCVFAIDSDAQITLTVASGVSSGFIEVVKASGVGISANPFIVATASSGGHVIRDETNIFTARTNLKFIGRVSVADDDINDATVINVSEGNNSSGSSSNNISTTPIYLDRYLQNIYVVYSLEKRINSYSGYACKLRRTSDDATQNFNFDDEENILTWANGSEIRIDTLYDQSGNGNHVNQSNLSIQPIYISSENSPFLKPCLYFEGNNNLNNPTPTGFTNQTSITATVRAIVDNWQHTQYWLFFNLEDYNGFKGITFGDVETYKGLTLRLNGNKHGAQSFLFRYNYPLAYTTNTTFTASFNCNTDLAILIENSKILTTQTNSALQQIEFPSSKTLYFGNLFKGYIVDFFLCFDESNIGMASQANQLAQNF